MRIVEYPPPNIGVEKPQQVQEKANSLVDGIIEAFTKVEPMPEPSLAKHDDVKPKEIIFLGNLDEANEFFYNNQWTDGLPIIPPTLEAVNNMLRYTDRSPDEMLGLLPPANRQATVWSVAVNGVMAGCRPEYMPVLLAIVEAILEPRFGIQEAGSTAGWTPMIVLNGPIIEELNFNAGLGVLRPQRKPNITIARFLRLYMVNVAGFIVGSTDMATFGLNYIPVLAEDENKSPYEPLSMDQGFRKGNNVVTILSVISTTYQFMSSGKAEDHLRTFAKEAVMELGTGFVRIMIVFGPEVSPLLCMSPLIASQIAEGGYSKDDIREYIYDHARIPAHEYTEHLQVYWPEYTITNAIEQGRLPKSFGLSEDPARMLPVLKRPDQLLIVVSGDQNRNRSFIAAQCGSQGLAVSKEINLPLNWEQLLIEAKGTEK
ncbi:hypothetical protein ACFLZG_06120 [Thermodesulfobacteriota bacterium]